MDMLKIEFKLLVYANPEFDYKPTTKLCKFTKKILTKYTSYGNSDVAYIFFMVCCFLSSPHSSQ